MNSSVSSHELCVPALCLMTTSINTLLLLSFRSYSSGEKKSDAKFEKLQEKIKEVIERYRFFHSLPCSA